MKLLKGRIYLISSKTLKIISRKPLFITIVLVSIFLNGFSKDIYKDSTPLSSQKQALYFLENLKNIEQSIFWTEVKPQAFIKNLRDDILHPLDLYEGSFTNFCGYAALSYLPLVDDPKTYINFMVKLYKEGRASYNTVRFSPSKEIMNAAGTLRFKGKLDIRPADQIWFLSLADHFKSYLNFFSHHYKPGAENTFWASVSYGKFNRMIKSLFEYNVKARGSDLFHPGMVDLVSYIKASLKTGTTFLYLNNEFLLKKNDNLKPGIPTHYVVLLDLISEKNGSLTMTYWDYGFRSVRQLTPAFLKKIVFGVTTCSINH